MEEFDKEELIERYLAGQLEGEQLKQFEEELQKNVFLKQELQIERLLQKNIRKAGRADLKSKFEELHKSSGFETEEAETHPITVKLQKENKKWVWPLSIAASVLVILSATWSILKEKSTSELFTAYYEPIPAPVSRSSATEDEISKGYNLYNKGKYQESITILKNVTGSNKNLKGEALFFLGCSYLSIGFADSAQYTYEVYIKNNQEYKEEAQWYLALALLKQDKKNEAKELLIKIVNEKNSYSESATKLLEDL